MSQQCITLVTPCISRRCYLLELPATIRRRIYDEAGIVSNRVIHLNNWRLCKDRNSEVFEETLLPALPLSLFAVCRFVYEEVRKVLYGENKIIISFTAPGGLRALEYMSQAIIQEIQLLVVRLNVSSCAKTCCESRDDRCGNRWFGCPYPSSHSTPLSSEVNQLIISKWHRICTKLASSIQPGKLALYVTCDCVDQTTARMITEPFLLLPALGDCGLRLAVHSDKELNAMAKDAVMDLTRRGQPLLPFRFMDLPKEIQLQILKYVSIIPVDEIICTEQKLRFRAQCQTKGGILHTPTGIIDASNGDCFCSAAHSAFIFCCTCPALVTPFAMFLVSREFRYCAMESFYGHNSFSVAMVGPRFSREDPTSSSSSLDDESENQLVEMRSDISILSGLVRFPHPSISYLTRLNLLFDWSALDQFQSDQPGWHNWLETIDTLFREADLPALTIQLRMRESFYPAFGVEKPAFDSAYESYMLRTYESLVQPLKILQGLKNLFIHLNWETSNDVRDGRREVEQRLERMVMGPTYDAWERGKTFRYPINWQELTDWESI